MTKPIVSKHWRKTGS